MGEAKADPDPTCVVLVDLGTTNARVWLAQGDRILARARAQVGVRDTARTGSHVLLRETLRSLIASVIQDAGQTQPNSRPSCVIAAGMITSSLGLAEVPHIPAPAGLAELAAATRRFDFPDVTDLPVLLVPGVRTGPSQGDRESLVESDLMRGEETLCMGLIALGLARKSGVVLNLGSHWKAVQIDDAGRVCGSITSMAGELIHAAQTSTILATALPTERPAAYDDAWIEAGMREQRRSGLSRAHFCVRLLEQGGGSTSADRLAFLVGAFLAVDLDGLLVRGAITSQTPVTIVGGGALAEAWERALIRASVPARAIPDNDIERAALVGMRGILAASRFR
jgi:2-dehydro-3-deoxygalactonokinase